MMARPPTPAQPSARPASRTGGARRPARSCVGCRESTDPEGLVRLVIGPEGEVLPDLAGRAHGRGAWVHPRPDCLTQAARRGLARSFREQIRTSPGELWELIRRAADRRVEGLICSAWRARKLELGSDAVREALVADRARLVVVATDARAAAETSWVQQAVVGGRARAWGTKEILGRAAGRAELGVVAVCDEGLAEALSFALEMAQMPAPAEVCLKGAQVGDSTEVG